MSKLKIICYSIFAILCIILQTVYTNAITFLGLRINLILVLAICIAIIEGAVTGAIFGFILGFFADFSGSGLFAFNSIVISSLAAGCGFLRKNYFVGNHYVTSTITLIASFLYGVLFYFICIRLSYESAIMYCLFRRIIPECLLNTLAAVIIYPCLRAFSPKITSPIGTEL